MSTVDARESYTADYPARLGGVGVQNTSTRPRLLDLFCGAGGSAVGYHRAGFEVVGVDINPQPHYPFEFHEADALEFLLDWGDADAVHASPPCQAFTAYGRTGRVGEHPSLIEPTRQALIASGRPWVMENVEGAPLRDYVTYCGTSFGVPIQRHRWFESSIGLLVPPCIHKEYPPRYQASTNRKPGSRRTLAIGQWNVPFGDQQAAMGIDWMDLEELSEAIPPAYTEHIGRQLIAHLASVAA